MNAPIPAAPLATQAGRLMREPALRWWRRFYWWRLDRATRREFRDIDTAIFYGISLGDNLLCTAVAREWHARHGGRIAVLTTTPEFFVGNPHVRAVHPLIVNRLHSLERLGVRVIRPDYRVPTADPDRDTPPSRHLIADMCASAGLSGRIVLKPDLFFRSDEQPPRGLFANSTRPLVAIMSGGSAAAVPMRNKDWPAERWQRVVELGHDRCDFVQLGLAGDVALKGTRDLRSQTTLRETAHVLRASSVFAGQVGLMMHLARAVDCPAVIVYGGRERPDQSGYTCNENLYSPEACSPCWRFNGCEFDRICLDRITPEQVWASIERLLTRPRVPLAVDTVDLA